MINPLKNLKISNLFMSVSKIDYVKVLYALGIVLLIFMLFRGCKSTDGYISQLKDLSSKYDSAMALKSISDKKIDSLHAIDSLKVIEIGYLNRVIDSQQVKLNSKSQSASSLAGTISKYPPKQPIDTLYRKACDSLAKLVLSMNYDMQDYQSTVGKLIRNYDSALDNRDKLINEQRNQIAFLKKTLDEYKETVDKTVPKLERHNELYLGGDIIGGKSDLIHGGGLSASLLNTKGTMYTVGAYKLNTDMFYSIGAKFRLSLRKK